MKRVALLGIVLLAVVGVGAWILSRAGFFLPDQMAPGEQRTFAPEEAGKGPTPTDIGGGKPVEYTYEPYVQDLRVPWSIVFTSPDRMLVSERDGRIRAVEAGALLPDPLIVFSDVSTQDEEGLMGMTPDPDYENNSYLYVCLAYPSGGGLSNKVVRLVDRQDVLEEDKTIMDGIPAARFHAGCRLAFGPDGKLYITTGDASEKQLAQDINSLAGKILRINPDGSIPSDNPFPDSPVYSYGHRNPQGLDWHPATGDLYSTEHGPSVWDGPAGGDEINRIVAGGNYGWPRVSHDANEEGLTAPLATFTPAEAPGSGMFYDGSVFPQFRDDFFFGALRGEGIIRIRFSETNRDEIVLIEKLPIEVGRVRDIVQGPDGHIYFSTSNRDGRGSVQDGDDKVYRIIPK